nr:F-box/kelch-repeat protein At1g15670-like [Ipomoea trifida]
MELIPGLPNDVALECLIRISFDQFPKAASVCRAWNDVIKQPEFFRRRKASGLTQPFIAMAESKEGLSRNRPVYRLTLFEPVKGRCYHVPPIPEMEEMGEGLPIFCRVVGIGAELAVIGGQWGKGRFVNSVFIYNFLSRRWRRGADMPGQERLFFGCAASEEEGTVVVAGGVDWENSKSTLAYDVARDRWTWLPDMSYARDECTCVFHGGKFHVVGSYEVEANQITETLDLVTRQWRLGDRISELATLSHEATYLQICGVIYIVSASKDVIVLEEDGTWVVIARVPDEIRNLAYVIGWQGKMVVIGSRRAYMLEVKSKKWTKVEIPSQYCAHVLSCCCIHL